MVQRIYLKTTIIIYGKITINKMKTVVVDAESIIAQANKNDSNYSKATKVSRDLMKSDVEMLYPVTAISEAITVLQSKLNSLPTAIGTASVFADQNYKIIEINHELYNNAVEKYFSHVTNKNDT